MEYLIRNVPYSIFHIVLNHVLGPSKAYQLTKTKSPTTTCLAHDSRGRQGDRAQPVIPGAGRGSRAQPMIPGAAGSQAQPMIPGASRGSRAQLTALPGPPATAKRHGPGGLKQHKCIVSHSGG